MPYGAYRNGRDPDPLATGYQVQFVQNRADIYEKVRGIYRCRSVGSEHQPRSSSRSYSDKMVQVGIDKLTPARTRSDVDGCNRACGRWCHRVPNAHGAVMLLSSIRLRWMALASVLSSGGSGRAGLQRFPWRRCSLNFDSKWSSRLAESQDPIRLPQPHRDRWTLCLVVVCSIIVVMS